MHPVHLTVIMFPGPRLKTLFKTFNALLKKIHTYCEFCEKCHLGCSVEPIACENPSVGSKFAANYPGRHLHISTRISHILHSLTGIFGHQPTIDERVYTRLVTITKLKIFKHIKMSPEHRNRERFNRLWVISMCFY